MALYITLHEIIILQLQRVCYPSQKTSTQKTASSTKMDVILLQETLCSAISLIFTLNSWLSNWTFHAMDASRRSGGTTIGFCNKSMDLRNLWGGRGFIGMDIYAHTLESEIRIMNVYGPCVDRATFWRSLLNSEILQADNIILGGDLNFSLGYCESWDHSAQVDNLSDTISTLLKEHQWVDIPSARVQYTWSNNRSGDHILARRLDRFLIKEAFLNSHPRTRQWVGTRGMSDHRPIFLELSNTYQKIKIPFKFNASWLKDPSYIQMVSNYWQSNPIMDLEDHTVGFLRKLTELKRISRNWAHQKQKNDDNILREAEQAIASFEDSSNGTFLSQENKDLYTSLVSKCSQILKEMEESW